MSSIWPRVLQCVVLAIPLMLLAAACGDSGSGTPVTGASIEPSFPPPTASSTPLATPAAGLTEYTVQPGDTLYSIAARFGVSVAAVAAANGIADISEITAGQVLTIPSSGVAAPTPAPVPFTPAPASGAPADVLSKAVNPDRRIVAFSFDAGSDVGYASQILDVLASNGIHASFGMTGRWAEQNPDLLKRIVRERHSLINHTYDHDSFTGRSTGAAALAQGQRWEELDRTEAIINELTGASTKPFFRPPYGDFDDSVNADVGARGYAYNVMWTVDSRGWTGIPASQIIQRCLDLAAPGAIYVFHVGSASQDGPALQSIIDGLRTQGYAIGSVPDMLAP